MCTSCMLYFFKAHIFYLIFRHFTWPPNQCISSSLRQLSYGAILIISSMFPRKIVAECLNGRFFAGRHNMPSAIDNSGFRYSPRIVPFPSMYRWFALETDNNVNLSWYVSWLSLIKHNPHYCNYCMDLSFLIVYHVEFS